MEEEDPVYDQYEEKLIAAAGCDILPLTQITIVSEVVCCDRDFGVLALGIARV